MKATYAAVKSETEYQKRKTLDSHLAKQPPATKRARANENAHERTSALIEELLERETRQLSGCQQQPPPLQHSQAGPTDFSGLFPKTVHAESLGLPPQPQPHRAARTFVDIASHRQSRQVLQDLLPSSDYLPAPLPALHAGTTNHASTTAGSRDRQLPASKTAPLDWSLKTMVRFSSPTPFTIAEEATFLGSGATVQAQRAFATSDGLHTLSMQQRYLAALHSWQFPANPRLNPASGVAKLRAPPPEVVQRWQDWQSAFASLYDMLRCGACDAFYYVSPEGTKKPFAAFFGSAGVSGRPRIHALLTRSTSGLRALLTGGLVLGFAAPLLPSEADRRTAELDQAVVPLDGSQSLLMFEGAVRVHGLFDFLLNESFRSHGDECDVPVLLSPVQFAHASLHAYQPRVLGVSDACDPGRAQHRLELHGAALPPWVLDRLAAVLAVTQLGNFSMACDTHQLTLALNWCPSSSGNDKPAAAGGGQAGDGQRSARQQVLGGISGAAVPQRLTEFEARQRGCWDAEEAGRWRTVAPGLSCNVLRELRCEGGIFIGKLSAKSAERIVM